MQPNKEISPMQKLDGEIKPAGLKIVSAGETATWRDNGVTGFVRVHAGAVLVPDNGEANGNIVRLVPPPRQRKAAWLTSAIKVKGAPLANLSNAVPRPA